MFKKDWQGRKYRQVVIETALLRTQTIQGKGEMELCLERQGNVKVLFCFKMGDITAHLFTDGNNPVGREN